MPNYQNGKIYKIESLEGNCIYYGSTTQTLCVRMAGHRAKYKQYIHGKSPICSSRVVKYDDAKIYLVEKYPCNTKEELCSREGYYIKNFECVNTQIAGRDKKGWYEDNKERILKENKQRYEVNRESILIKHKQYYKENKEYLLKQNKEYREKNKEDVIKRNRQYYEKIKNNQYYKEKQKKYRDEHKDDNKTYSKEYRKIQHICECGKIHLYSEKSKHLKTTKHKTLLSDPFINFKL
jgi:hypothetical protein